MSQNTPAVTTTTSTSPTNTPTYAPQALDPATVNLDISRHGSEMDVSGPSGQRDGQISVQEYLAWKAGKLGLSGSDASSYTGNSTNQDAFKNAEKREGGDRNTTMNYSSSWTLANNPDRTQTLFNRVAGGDGAISRDDLKAALNSKNPEISGFARVLQMLHTSGADVGHTLFGTAKEPKAASYDEVMKLAKKQVDLFNPPQQVTTPNKPPADTTTTTPPTTTGSAPSETIPDTTPVGGKIDPVRVQLDLDRLRDPKNGFNATTGTITIEEGAGFAQKYPSLYQAVTKLISDSTPLDKLGLTPQADNKLSVNVAALEQALDKAGLSKPPVTGQVNPVSINREFNKLRDPANGFDATNRTITIDEGAGFANKYPGLYFAVSKLIVEGAQPKDIGLTTQPDGKLKVDLNALEKALKTIGVDILPPKNVAPSTPPTSGTTTPQVTNPTPSTPSGSNQYSAGAFNTDIAKLTKSSFYNSETGNVKIPLAEYSSNYKGILAAVAFLTDKGKLPNNLVTLPSDGTVTFNLEALMQALNNA